MAHDLLYAFRTFRRAPAFALTAIVTFALGIGATTAMFSTVNAVEDHFGCAAVSVPERDEQQREQRTKGNSRAHPSIVLRARSAAMGSWLRQIEALPAALEAA